MKDVPYLYPTEPVPVRLMNTIWADRHGVHDAMTTREHVQLWLDRSELGDSAKATASDVESFRELRDALRRIAADVVHDDRLAAQSKTEDLATAISDLNTQIGRRTPRFKRVGAASFAMVWELEVIGVDRLRSDIAMESLALFTGEAASRLRACHAPGCVLYFIKDHPRREWCSARCGNRARVARHYERHHSTQASA